MGESLQTAFKNKHKLNAMINKWRKEPHYTSSCSALLFYGLRITRMVLLSFSQWEGFLSYIPCLSAIMAMRKGRGGYKFRPFFMVLRNTFVVQALKGHKSYLLCLALKHER